MNVIIAGGGTGGHIFPAVAIGHAVQRHYPGANILFVGAKGKMEMEKVPQEGFRIIGLDITGFNRSNLLKNLMLPFKLIKSRNKAKQIIKAHHPDIVIGVGGYASFPMLHAAQARGIPTLIQEQNSHAGKSNMILGKRAERICVAYDNMAAFFPAEKIVYTGNPVRALITRSTISQNEGKQAFGLDINKKTLLIVGGSLGALAINEAINNGWGRMIAEGGIQVLWQTGKGFYEKAIGAAGNNKNIVVKEFIRNMDEAYAAADIIVSRAGAMAISELCIVGKPVIFVPYPFASEDHQTRNAQSLVDKKAARMVKNSETGDKLVDTVLELIKDQKTGLLMSENIKKLAITDADERILAEIKAIVSEYQSKSGK